MRTDFLPRLVAGLVVVSVLIPYISFALPSHSTLLSPSSYNSLKHEFEPVFNTPGFKDLPDNTIENKIVDLIQSAVPGSSIYISIYVFTHPVIASALLEANERGVSVELVIDGKSKKHLKKRDHAIRLLTTTPSGQPALRCHSHRCVTFCDSIIGTSCRGLHINHNKFILLSQLKDGSRNVVAQTSYNFNYGQNFQYNDMMVIRNDPQLYEGYLRYWQSMKSDKVKMTHVESIHGAKGVKAYLFPRLKGEDPVLKILETVSCEPAGSKIRLVQSRFDRFRVQIAHRLATLREQGCDVKVIVRSETRLISPTKKLRPLLGPDLYILPFQSSKGRTLQINSVHSKVILIDAAIKGSKERKPLVLMGSHNLDLPSLRTNDEVMLSIPSREVYEKYLRYWEGILEEAFRAGILTPQES